MIRANGGVVRSDCIIQIHPNGVEVSLIESHNGDEPGGSVGGALRHAQPFVESAGDAKNSQGDSNRVDG